MNEEVVYLYTRTYQASKQASKQERKNIPHSILACLFIVLKSGFIVFQLSWENEC